jgi:RNA polymerase sigma factor (sigma-70 family)
MEGMMESENDLRERETAVFREIAHVYSREHAAALQMILAENKACGRLQNYLQQHREHTVESYIHCLAAHYAAGHPYVKQIQVEKDDTAWLGLLEKMRKWAYSTLSRWGLETHSRVAFATDIAHDAAAVVMSAYYPYDVPFFAWACRITQNWVYKHMKKDNALESAVDPSDLTEIIEPLQALIPAHRTTEELISQRDELLRALEKLPPGQREVIWRHYFEGCSFAEIAAKDGATLNAIYKRHYDGLSQLRKILQGRKDKDE